MIGFAFLLNVKSQNYYHLRADGNLPKGYYLDKIYESSKKILLNEPNNDAMSAIDRIPFDFNFYGKTYRSFRVSDNGYLSFDTLSIDSQEPDSVLPKNSIVGFWKDFKMQKLPTPNQGVGIQVFSYTDGLAPNRRHIVQFFGLSLINDDFSGPVTNANIYAFAIILHEGNEGRFDLVYTPYGDKNQKASIGCSNDDNSITKLLNDSISNLPFQFSFEKDKFIVYQFIYGNQPNYDLSIKSINLSKIYQTNAVVNFSGVLYNVGRNKVNSLNLNYSVNQGDTIVYPLSGLNILANAESSYSFNHPISWTSGATGSLNNVNFWLSDPNGQKDEDSTNSHISRIILRNNSTNYVQRNVIFEEGTGAWCGYCPDAHLILDEAVKLHGDRVIPVSYHSDDSMSYSDGDEFLRTYVTSYPDAILDRKVFLGSNNTWLNELSTRLNGNAPVEVSIDLKSFNIQTRVISYTVKVKFIDYWYGNLNLGSIVTEDRIRGNAFPNIWSQNNYYSKFHNGGVGGPSHPMYNELEYMDGYLHNHVSKANPGGIWGISGIIPEYIVPNAEYSQTFTYTLPPAEFVSYSIDNNTEFCSTVDLPGQNEGRNIPAFINLIGYVSQNDSDAFKREIINAGYEKLWNLTGIREVFLPESISIYPNPANHAFNLAFKNADADEVLVEITDVHGRTLKSLKFDHLYPGDNVLFIDCHDLSPGVYNVILKSPGQYSSNKLTIVP